MTFPVFTVTGGRGVVILKRIFGSVKGLEVPGCFPQLLLSGSANQAFTLLKGVSIPIYTADCTAGLEEP